MDEFNLVAAVRKYARDHYNVGGWDILVECYDDGDILELIEDATTVADAVSRVAKVLKIKADYRADIQAEAF